MEISFKQMLAYEKCREQGKYNMFDFRSVSSETGLEKDEIIYIMKHYSELKKQYKLDK
jgi:hypothetical protein